MAENESLQAEPSVEPQAGDSTEPQGTEDKDWQAEYEKLLAQSRKWEERAKKNVAAAKELDEIKAQSMTDAERAQEATRRAEEAEAKIAEYERKAERESIISEVAESKQVDADILARMMGDTREEIEANADWIAAKLAEKHLYPSVADKGQQTPPKQKPEDIRAIKDPQERIHARARLIAQNRK